MASRERNEKERKKILGRIPQRINELDKQIADLKKKKIDQANQDAEILLREIQTELSQLFLLDNFSILEAVKLLAWSPEIIQFQVDKNFHDIDKILTAYFERVQTVLPIVKDAVLDGTLECLIVKIATAESSKEGVEAIDENKSKVTKSAMRNWLLTKPGYFSPGFFPEINIESEEERELVRLRMLADQEKEVNCPGTDGKTYSGNKEIVAAFAAKGRKVGRRQILNYKKDGLAITYTSRGKKEIPQLTDSAIREYLFNSEMKKKKKR